MRVQVRDQERECLLSGLILQSNTYNAKYNRYIRSREQSLEKRRNVIGNHSRYFTFYRKNRSNSLSELSRKSSSSLVNSRDNLPRSKSQKAAIRPRKEPTSLDFLKENNSIDQRLEEIHRILKSTLS